MRFLQLSYSYIMVVDDDACGHTSDTWWCLFEGHSMCQEDTRHSMCLRTGRRRVVSTNAHRVAAHFVSGSGPRFAAFSPFEHLIVIILVVSENQYGDCIQNSGGWVMAERRGSKPKLKTAPPCTSLPLLLLLPVQ